MKIVLCKLKNRIKKLRLEQLCGFRICDHPIAVVIKTRSSAGTSRSFKLRQSNYVYLNYCTSCQKREYLLFTCLFRTRDIFYYVYFYNEVLQITIILRLRVSYYLFILIRVDLMCLSKVRFVFNYRLM